ncbi:dihydropteroate synthase [Celeribacter persicus]|jgi:dihydropteroate synthase|uniref:Dihydropteroate synthase n=1 Tax=Celeribacter persicus TaxID=1651082 RepID=A0A2T5HM00_9RHOB|nr:dihydropteroate synthase [Celeribacter persicus]PTQ72605.1 dihydropteroate synthase [Celeribacter persicus]
MAQAFYDRPIPSCDPARPEGALTLAGGWCWFTHVERLRRDEPPEILPVSNLSEEARTRLTARRAPLAGLDLGQPSVMSILNVTPDSFSDGGKFNRPEVALAQVQEMLAAGVDIIDIGGESTRPGADYVPVEEEIVRTTPVIEAIRAQSTVPISIDTRKGQVAQAALKAGASLVNDVYAFTHDPDLARVSAEASAPVCLMHAQGDPEVMQDDPHYDNVLLDVYDFLEDRIEVAEVAGIPRAQILVDPGIGFGKTVAHNLALLERISLFHGLGCGILLGVSRKGFIGKIGRAPVAQDRAPGTMAVTLAALGQGIQIHRVHDFKETKQALALWQAATGVGDGYVS